MATTKSARDKFKVKEGIGDPFIIAEHNGREPRVDPPLREPDFLCFGLRPGICAHSLRDEIERDFMRSPAASVAAVVAAVQVYAKINAAGQWLGPERAHHQNRRTHRAISG